ncbi:MAG TPA: branched-chain amino acid ABC transporter permease [Pseudolabrys sp.]|nr:branched-chain amino acid ABC transporter permease [Pseudolabrys sp.]
MTRFVPWLFVALLASVPLWMTDYYYLHVLITTGIFIIAAMSLNLLLGYTGQLSLGHVAFFGIGAYTSALVSLGFNVHVTPDTVVSLSPKPVWFAILCAIVVSGLVGYIIGKLSFRVRGAYFVIVSISFAEVVRLIALNWVELTQGPMALNSIPALTLGFDDYTISFLRKPQFFYLMLVMAVISYLIVARLVNSRAGRAMIALRENESLAMSVGIDVTRYLVLATVVSAAIAGMAGALYTHYIRIVDPNIFLFIYTVTMVIMVVTGGKGTLAGPIVGGVMFGIVPEVLRGMKIVPEVQWIVYGVLMIAIVYFLPEGIVPAVRRVLASGRGAFAGSTVLTESKVEEK